MKKTWFIATLFFALPQVIQASSFNIQQWQTKNGASVFFYQAKEVPMLDISVTFAAGSAYDGQFFGLSTLTTNLINQGNGGLSATTIAEQLADTGAQFHAENSRDMVVLELKTLTSPKALTPAIEAFKLIVNKPDFHKDAFDREKNQQLLAIAQSQEAPDDIANILLFKKLYGTHPYAHPINGTKESVSALQLGDVRNFYNHYFVASNALVVMVGAIEKEEAQQLAEQIVAFLPKGQPAPSIPKATPLDTPEKIAVDFPSSQTIIRLAQVGIDHHDPDYFPLTVGNYILGGGALVSRLSYEVRERRGLTYDIASQFLPMPGYGPFIISFSTQNKEANTALKVTEDTLAKYIHEGPSEEELIAAKQYLTGSFPLSLASNSSIANMLLRIAFYHLPMDYLDTYVNRINAVTTAQIREALHKKINLDKMLYVAVGKK